MTSPVRQQTSEKIAMTAPVLQEEKSGPWKVQFIMPPNYTMATLPKPVNDSVKLIELPTKRIVVISFSGIASDAKLRKYTAELSNFIIAEKLNAKAPPIYAFYDPPWTLPFLRRNEVMIEVVSD